MQFNVWVLHPRGGMSWLGRADADSAMDAKRIFGNRTAIPQYLLIAQERLQPVTDPSHRAPIAQLGGY